MTLTLEKGKRLYKLAYDFLDRSMLYEKAYYAIKNWLAEHHNEIELEVRAWPCKECHSIHASTIQSPFNVPQPDENGILTCSRCGATSTVDEALDLLEELHKIWEDSDRDWKEMDRRKKGEEDSK